MKNANKKLVTSAMVASVIMGGVAPMVHAEALTDTQKDTNKDVVNKTENVTQNTQNNQESGKTFTDEEKQAIDAKINEKNKTRNELILDAVNSGNWDAYRAFEAKDHPAWYEKTQDGKYVENKIYYGNLLEHYVSWMRQADAKFEQAKTDAEKLDALKERQVWEKRIVETLIDFKKAPGIVPYIIGINSNEAYAKQYGVEQPSKDYFNSKYNHPSVLSDGTFAEKAQKDSETKVEADKTQDTTKDTTKAEVKEESKESVVTDKTTTVKDQPSVSDNTAKDTEFVDDVVIVDDGVFTDEEKQAIDARIHKKNMTRNELILDAVASGNWDAYHEFEAKNHPAWYEKTEDGKYVPNKIYFGNLLESKVFTIRDAQFKYEQAKTSEEKESALKERQIWEKSLRETLEDFKKAPGIVPYIVGINNTQSVADEFGVEQPSKDYFDSKYNHPSVMDNGTFAE